MIEWKCPKCSAIPNSHGHGGREACVYKEKSLTDCYGFICECHDPTSVNHGETYEDRCYNAVCYHCGWSGVFPRPIKGLTPWESKALAAGWTPPAARAVELGIAAIAAPEDK